MWLSQNNNKPGQQHGWCGPRSQKGEESERERWALSQWRGLRGLGSQEDGDWRVGVSGAGPQAARGGQSQVGAPSAWPLLRLAFQLLGNFHLWRAALGKTLAEGDESAGKPAGGHGKPCARHPVLNCDFARTVPPLPFPDRCNGLEHGGSHICPTSGGQPGQATAGSTWPMTTGCSYRHSCLH